MTDRNGSKLHSIVVFFAKMDNGYLKSNHSDIVFFNANLLKAKAPNQKSKRALNCNISYISKDLYNTTEIQQIAQKIWLKFYSYYSLLCHNLISLVKLFVKLVKHHKAPWSNLLFCILNPFYCRQKYKITKLTKRLRTGTTNSLVIKYVPNINIELLNKSTI